MPLNWKSNYWIKKPDEPKLLEEHKRFLVHVTGQSHILKFIGDFNNLAEAKAYCESLMFSFNEAVENDFNVPYYGPLFTGYDIIITDTKTKREWMHTGNWEEIH